MGQRGKIRTLARYIDFNSVILRLKRKALCFPNLVSLLPKSKIKRANPLAVCQFINCIHRRLRLTERGRMFFKRICLEKIECSKYKVIFLTAEEILSKPYFFLVVFAVSHVSRI